MALYDTYSTNIINEMVHAINHLHKLLSRHERILSGRQLHWYKDNILEKRTANMILSSLLYLHELKIKYVNAYKYLIGKLYSYINAIHIFSLAICLSIWYPYPNLME